MLTNATATVWHYNDNSETYTISIIGDCWAKQVKKISISKDGANKASSLVLRIPTSNEIDVVLGDYIRVGEYSDSSPNRGVDFKVTEISDNRHGTQKHWRVTCE